MLGVPSVEAAQGCDSSSKLTTAALATQTLRYTLESPITGTCISTSESPKYARHASASHFSSSVSDLRVSFGILESEVVYDLLGTIELLLQNWHRGIVRGEVPRLNHFFKRLRPLQDYPCALVFGAHLSDQLGV